jgi:hypothetical protein
MKIRVMGLPDEARQAVETLCNIDDFDVIEVNGPYPNRGNSRMIRVYIEARLNQWCGRSWHDGDCCPGSRNQWNPGHPAIGHAQQPELPA